MTRHSLEVQMKNRFTFIIAHPPLNGGTSVGPAVVLAGALDACIIPLEAVWGYCIA